MKTGHTPSRNNPDYWIDPDIPWFTLADVWQLRDDRQVHLGNTASQISQRGLQNSAAELLPQHTVVLSRTASIGFSGVMPIPMATSQDFWNWVCGPELIPEYLNYQFKSMRPELRSLNIGSTHKTIYQKDAAGIRIFVPPVATQRSIVAFLDRETARIDTLIEAQLRLVATLRERRVAVAENELSSLVWNVPLRTVATLIQTGPFGSQLKSDEYEEGGVPVINPSHMVGGRIVPDPKVAVSDTKATELHRHALAKGDLVLARRGELGRCAVVDSSAVGFLCGTGSALVRPVSHRVASRFLALALDSRAVRDSLALSSVGSTMANLNSAIVAALRVPIPTRSEQDLILFRVDQQTAKIHALIAEAERFVELSRERRSALIAAAVTGQIDVRHEAA